MALPQDEFRTRVRPEPAPPSLTSIVSTPGASAFAAPPRARFDEFIRWTIGGERATLAGRLPADEREAFLNYYSGLPDPRDEAAVRRYLRGLWHSDIGWVARWIAERASERPLGLEPVRVLDAGSGFGTYSMLYACMGAEVAGADLRDDRLLVSRRRLELFEERTRRGLRVRFERIDVTEEIESKYDLVWVYNAISHIDPVEPFLKGVARQLAPQGVLVIGDINGGNPQHTRRLDALRSEVHGTFTDADGGVHRYAHEQTFSPEDLERVLHQNGFVVAHHELLTGGAGRTPEALQGLLRLGASIPWLSRKLARRQFVVASAAYSRSAVPSPALAVAARKAS